MQVGDQQQQRADQRGGHERERPDRARRRAICGGDERDERDRAGAAVATRGERHADDDQSTAAMRSTRTPRPWRGVVAELERAERPGERSSDAGTSTTQRERERAARAPSRGR